jgi:hypothetical protein
MAIDSIDLTFTSGTDKITNYYVRLGALLQFIEEKIMYQAKALNSTTLTPMLKFDYDVDSNLMYIDDEYQTSIDPSICVINRTVLDYLPPPAVNITNPDNTNGKGDVFDSPLFSSLPTVYGQIMNIYVNMSFVLTKMDELKDANTNKVTLIDLINNILSAINSSLGGTTSLEANIDEDTNTLTIRDANPLPNTDEVIKILNANNSKLKIPNKYTQFELYGYNGSSASFIKDFSLKTEITPELSMMITVAATANSTVVGENSTAFSKFNAGLTDRFKTEIEDSPPAGVIPVSVTAAAIGFGINSGSGLFGALNKPAAITAANVQAIKDAAYAAARAKYLQTIIDYQKYLRKLVAGEFNKEEAETYKSALNNIITYKQQWLNAMYNKLNINTSIFSPSTGFIPFNLSLTMDGLSGMKIYSKFLINTEFLPANYPNNAEFLIKSIQHKIENNKWFTTLESIVISKGDTDKSIYNKNKPTSNTTSPSPGSGSSPSPTSFFTASAVVVSGSPLRKAIVRWAEYYYNQNIWEKRLGFKRGDPQDLDFLTGQNGPPNVNFRNEMKSVGWQIYHPWCNYFAKLVWKKAYEEVGKTDANIKNIMATTMNNFAPYKGPVSSAVPTTYAQLGKLGAVETFIPGKTKIYPGDYIMYDWPKSPNTQDHIGICIQSDNNARTMITIGGNEGPGRILRQNKKMDSANINSVARPIE